MSAISSVTSLVKGGGRPTPARAYIIPLDIYNNDTALVGEKRYFQYFPESITDAKQTNYDNKNITSLSHPIYQWISGGERIVSFTAIFTRDEAPTKAETSYLANARAAAATTNTIVGEFADVGDVGKKFSDPRNVDIPSAVAWLRSFQYPWYASNYNGVGPRQHPKPPRKLLLGVPGVRLNYGDLSNISTELCCIMTQCEPSYEGFFSDGSPRIARVQLQFAETIQRGGRVRAQDAFALRATGLAGYRIAQSNQDKKQR